MPQGGLAQMLAEQGGSEDLINTAQKIEGTPGGSELLYTMAAEEMMKAVGGKGSQAKKLRLYALGEDVKKAEGGLAQAAEQVRKAGRDEDEMLVHMTADEFDALKAMWGDPDINPNTGIPEYGFLKKLWKGVKKGVKKIVKSKIFKTLAPIALSVFAPGLGTAVGSALGASGAAAGIVGNAVVQGGLGAVTGGKRGALAGLVGGATAGGLGRAAGKAVGLTGRTADIVGSGLVEGAGSAVTGGDFATGAVRGGLSAYTRPMEERLAGGVRRRLGLGKDTVGTLGGDYGVNPITGEPVSAAGDPGFGGRRPPVITPSVTTGGAPKGGTNFADLALKYGLPAAGVLGALSGGGGDVAPSGAPALPPGFSQPLPELTFDRPQQPLAPQDYYTYGQAGAPQQGEHLFFGKNVLPSTTVAPGAPSVPSRGDDGRGGLFSGVSGTMYRLLSEAGLDPAAFYGKKAAEGGYATGGRGLQRGGEFDFNEQNADALAVASREGGHQVRGPGSGREDAIDAKLSDGEYVIDAESVALLGDGSGDEGARKLDELRRNLRKHKGTNLKRGDFSLKAKSPEAYLPKKRKRKSGYEHGGGHNVARGGGMDELRRRMT